MVIQELKPSARVEGRWLAVLEDGSILRLGQNEVADFALYPGRELTVLFGCTGGKGIDRREGMGNAAGELADRVILTEDDPGPEAVEAICADIGVFLQRHGKAYTVVPNREQAVEQAILGARRPAVVLLAGKGCETQQKRKSGPEPCIPDGELARRTLERYDGR